jgi:hypothetical protein
MKKFILDRAKEPSTWRGISLFLTALGVYVDPTLYQQITTIGLSVAGILGMATKG